MDDFQERAIRFFQTWTTALSQEIGLLAGKHAEVKYDLGANAKIDPATQRFPEYLWWKQSFHASAEFSVWIGAAEETWSGLGAFGQTVESSRQNYMAMLIRSLEATAQALAAELTQSVVCREGEIDPGPPLETLSVAMIAVTLDRQRLPNLVVAVEAASLPALAAKDSIAATIPGREPRTDRSLGPVLERLVSLELPLSVSLGRAQLPIRDVLKLTAGSLIELDHHVGDSVEVLVHGKVIARGEVVSVKGNYGIRILELIGRRGRRDRLPDAFINGPQPAAASEPSVSRTQ